jgi:hypothetical protein
MSRSRGLLLGLALMALILGVGLAWAQWIYPSDRTPEGAYLRIVQAVNQDRPQDFFAYTDEEAQHACYSLLDYHRRAEARILGAYPEEKRASALVPFRAVARLNSPPDVLAYYARREGWLSQLRRDLSAVAKVESMGPRATVVTVGGSRYALRRRPGGIYGLSAFTPFLREEAEKSARDFVLIDRTASEYEAMRKR